MALTTSRQGTYMDKNISILIYEKEKDLNSILFQLMSDIVDYEIYTANDQKNLLGLANKKKIDICLLNINDIDSNHMLLSDKEVINKLIDVEVGFSFFPQDGIFNQMISTGTFELISSRDLKMNLLEMYNHQMERNIAQSKEIDEFNLKFRNLPYSRFRIRFDYNLLEGDFYGSPSLTNFNFDNEFYNSDEFYGILSQAKLYSNMYKRLLNDVLNSYKETLLLSKSELKT